MFDLKFSKLGALALNHLTAAASRSPSSNAIQHQNFPSPMIKRLFCTTAQNHNGIEDLRRITYRSRRSGGGHDIIIVKIPVGMSYLQAAQENKIEVEGVLEELPRYVCGRWLGKDEFIFIGGHSRESQAETGKIIYAPGLTKRARLVISPTFCLEYSGFQLTIPGCDKKVFF